MLFRKKKVFYLHLCYYKTQEGITYSNDCVVAMTKDHNMPWLRNALKELMEESFGIKLKETPVISSMTEISKELYDALTQA